MSLQAVEFVHSLSDGGAETIVKEYVRLIDKTIIDPLVLVNQLNHQSANEKEVMASGVKVLPICSDSYLQKLYYHFSRKVFTEKQLKRILSEIQPDVLHVHGQLLHSIADLSDSLKHTKLFYTCHSVAKRYFSGEYEAEFSAAKKLITNNGLQMIALHDQMREELNNLFGIENTIVLRNGVDFNKFHNIRIDTASYRESLGIPQDAFVVGHVGRFIYIKNQSFLVNVFAKVLERNPKAFLLMIGHGDDLNMITELINQKNLSARVLILSHRSDIAALLRCMDVFVFPSLFEGIPLTLIEAQVSGLRCICSNAINHEAIISERTVSISLNAGVDSWAELVMDSQATGTAYVDPNAYDMNCVVKNLEALYQQ